MTAPTGRALVNAQAAIESFALSPDGSTLVYVLRRVERGAYVSHLWAVAWDGGRPRRLTDGSVRDSAPAISPDGQRLAFVRSPVGDDDAVAQLWLMPLGGGRPRRLTRQKYGAGTPRWNPDAGTLAFLGPAGEQPFLLGSERPKRSPLARRITRTDFRDDESGHVGRHTHLWAVRADGSEPARQLTNGEFDVAEPVWSPDGSWLAFSADTGPDTNIAPRTCIYRVAAGGGKHRLLAELPGDASSPAISPDGRQLAFRGTDVADPGDAVLTTLWIAPVRGGAPRRLGLGLDRSVENGGWADLVMAEDVAGPLWLDAHSLVALIGDRGRNVPHRFELDGGWRPLVDPGRLVGAGLAVAGERLALSAGVDGRAAELYGLEGWQSPPGRLRQITIAGSRWQRRFPIPAWEEHWIDGPGGRIQTWVVSPPDAPAGPMPSVLIFHGGPTGASAPGGTLDSSMLTGHGYRVVLPNIRGSDTFGSEWIAALGGRWGDVDAEDVEAVAAALVADGLLEAGRIGIMGLSYGGFVAQWMAMATDTFAAAVAENGVGSQLSAWGSSYFGVHYNRRAQLADPLTEEGVIQLWRTSPLRHATATTTPLLMLQSEEDRICTPEDNLQLFTALKVAGKEVELILYPEEHHEMKNYGRPDRRIDRMERVLAWFDRWLRTGASGR